MINIERIHDWAKPYFKNMANKEVASVDLFTDVVLVTYKPKSNKKNRHAIKRAQRLTNGEVEVSYHY